MSTSNKILVSMIAYREKYLGQSVRDCYEKADNPQNLIFSIVSEQAKEDMHPDLSFIPDNQLIYRKYDLSEYRGVLWSRHKTTEVPVDYDYILYTCGHNRFVKSWDTKVFTEYQKALKKSEKALITVAAPEVFFDKNDNPIFGLSKGRIKNYWRGKFNGEYIPGYGWPEQTEVPETDDVLEETYIQFSWVFGPKKYVEEAPLDPDMNYHGEEIYTTIQTWCRGWRMFTTPVVMYYHDTQKEYPNEEVSRMATHRPWSDGNKNAFWKQSDDSMIKLNSLLSGNLTGKYGGISSTLIKSYCKFSGLNEKWCEFNPNYDKLGLPRHAEDFRYREPTLIDWY